MLSALLQWIYMASSLLPPLLSSSHLICLVGSRKKGDAQIVFCLYVGNDNSLSVKLMVWSSWILICFLPPKLWTFFERKSYYGHLILRCSSTTIVHRGGTLSADWSVASARIQHALCSLALVCSGRPLARTVSACHCHCLCHCYHLSFI